MENGIHIDAGVGGSAPEVAAATPHTTASKDNNTYRESATSAGDLLGMMGASATLSPEAGEYMKRLKSELDTELLRYASMGDGQSFGNIEVAPVANESCCIYRVSLGEKLNVLVGFSDTYTPPADNMYCPPAFYLRDARKVLQRQGRVVNTTLIIKPADYPLVTKMAQHLARTFVTMARPQAYRMTLKQLTFDSYTVTTNLENVRSILATYTPTAGLPPVEFGLAIYSKPTVKHPQRLLAAVGGYTRFHSSTPNGEEAPAIGITRTPIVTITQIVTPTPSVDMGIFAISLAAQNFVLNGGWMKQFRDQSKERPDIGNLAFSSADDPAIASLEMFVASKLNPPRLAIDIVDGMPRLAGLERISVNDINEDVASFLGLESSQVTPDITNSRSYVQFIGELEDGSDTRSQTFLELCRQDPTGVTNFTRSLVWNEVVESSLRNLHDFGIPSVITPLYINATSLLSLDFLQHLANAITLNIEWDDANGIGNSFAMPAMSQNTYGANQFYSGGLGGGGMNQNIYGI